MQQTQVSQQRLLNIAGHLVRQGQFQSYGNLTSELNTIPFDQDQVLLQPEKLIDEIPQFVVRRKQAAYKLKKYLDPSILTLYDSFNAVVSKYPQIHCLGWREPVGNGLYGPYKWLTYKEVQQIRNHIGSAYVNLGIQGGDRIGIYSANCPEWLLMQLGAYTQGIVTVPLYDTLGPDSAQYICNHAELKLVGCHYNNLKSLLKCLEQGTQVQNVVVWGYPRGFDPQSVKTQTQLLTIDQLKSIGQQNPKPHRPPSHNDMASMYYTSGTTGNPKGVVLSHENFIANVAGCQETFQVDPGSKHLSFLPLAHIFERSHIESMLYHACSIGFFHGNVLEVIDDVQMLNPNSMTSVPRIWNRIYEKVMSQILNSNILARNLFWYTYNQRLKTLQNGRDPTEPMTFMEKTVFRKISQALGGDLNIVISGGSPINKEVFEFMKVTFGCNVVEGYGLTETTSAMAVQDTRDYVGGQVGFPLTSCEVKLVDIPEMGYLTTDMPYQRGEICCRGPSIFKGYYKNEEATQESIDSDGWFHTGDVGMLIEKNRLKIIDRKKNLFKLAQGEYVSPERLENTYLNSQFVEQCFVHGDSLQTKLVAIVYPQQEFLTKWAASKGVSGSFEEICQNPGVVREVLLDMQETGRLRALNGYEIVAAVTLFPEMFTAENDLLTPSLKLKRNVARKIFEKYIDKMYSEIQQH